LPNIALYFRLNANFLQKLPKYLYGDVERPAFSHCLTVLLSLFPVIIWHVSLLVARAIMGA
jgi:hypothetical protein